MNALPVPDRAYTDHCLELLQTLGACTARRMFGGWGLYLDGLMFGLIANERLYLKVDPITEPGWQASGGQPFVYNGRGRSVKMNYYSPPDETLESPAAMAPWARLALEAALRARAARPASSGSRARRPALKGKRAGGPGRRPTKR
ncbi:TfoX/Sxy family protein [Caldimonas brevitalea]|uniref:DNA transformation protein n=1 Tax=Caldimonas brevitalea TaxID=413882 RepID=A0A0G3BCY3_9BURK|nr:TfoX/Sxy family protein [Caldimonas brevitalea]AKJ27249.1 DNA transformation protein [Caldimonas brevitalea]